MLVLLPFAANSFIRQHVTRPLEASGFLLQVLRPLAAARSGGTCRPHGSVVAALPIVVVQVDTTRWRFLPVLERVFRAGSGKPSGQRQSKMCKGGAERSKVMHMRIDERQSFPGEFAKFRDGQADQAAVGSLKG